MVAVEDENAVLRATRDNLPTATHNLAAVAFECGQEIRHVHVYAGVVLRGRRWVRKRSKESAGSLRSYDPRIQAKRQRYAIEK